MSMSLPPIDRRYDSSRKTFYDRIKDPNHPLAMGNGTVFVHRWLLYAEIDELEIGPDDKPVKFHRCHWCARVVIWSPSRELRRTGAALEIDHLDGDGINNDLQNLVPSCHRCNHTRSKFENPLPWVRLDARRRPKETKTGRTSSCATDAAEYEVNSLNGKPIVEHLGHRKAAGDAFCTREDGGRERVWKEEAL